ncbi:hypothetical protein [uncultured Clostridium sp.]|jgi:hypothetical protein|uniref:hypothetical protein n=1 Tax=uncultured Clostridium sp. TaxID=59620 RepID=UPI0026107B1A|nr:hypothetical protein [uncultured Clostridium sp.]
MYKNDFDKSFNKIKNDYNEDTYYCESNHQGTYKKNNENYKSEEKLNLTLRISYEIIEEISASDEMICVREASDVKKDILIERKIYYRVYGKAVDYKGISYSEVLIRLFKYTFFCGEVDRKEVDKIFTNEYGEFNFIIRIESGSNLESYKAEIDNYYKTF